MPKRKKEPAARVRARVQRFRARRLNQQRAANEIFYRNLLQRFYEARGLQNSDWTSLDEFYEESLAPLISREAFVGGLRHLGAAIETGRAALNGESIQIVRPKYFLTKG